MQRELLHSGDFITNEGDKVTVKFFRKYDIHVSPNILRFNGFHGGVARVTIWSKKGSVVLSDPPSWLDYRQVSVDPVPGTKWYSYTYDIICSQTSDQVFRWNVYMEDGDGTGIATTYFTVEVDAETIGDVVVDPDILWFGNLEESNIVTLKYWTGEPGVNNIVYQSGGEGWVHLDVLDYPGKGLVRYKVSVDRNPAGQRACMVYFHTYTDNPLLRVYQSANPQPETTTITAVPSSISFWFLGGTRVVDVTYNGVEPSYSKGAGWLSMSKLAFVNPTTVRYELNAWTTNKGPERFTTVTFYDDTGGLAEVSVTQEGSYTSLAATPSDYSTGEMILPYNGIFPENGVRTSQYQGDDHYLTVYHTGNLRFSCESWIRPEMSVRMNDSTTYSMMAVRNTTSESRFGTLVFTDSVSSIQIPVGQDRFGKLRAFPYYMLFMSNGRMRGHTGVSLPYAVTVVCSSRAVLSWTSPSWISFTSGSSPEGLPDYRDCGLTVSPNTTGVARTGFVDLSIDGDTARVEVVQEG